MSLDWTKGAQGNLRIDTIRKPEPGVVLSVGDFSVRLTTQQVAEIGAVLTGVALSQQQDAATPSTDEARAALAVEKSREPS